MRQTRRMTERSIQIVYLITLSGYNRSAWGKLEIRAVLPDRITQFEDLVRINCSKGTAKMVVGQFGRCGGQSRLKAGCGQNGPAHKEAYNDQSDPLPEDAYGERLGRISTSLRIPA